MWTAESWLISESSRKGGKAFQHQYFIRSCRKMICGSPYCSNMAYFFGGIPTAFVNDFKKLL